MESKMQKPGDHLVNFDTDSAEEYKRGDEKVSLIK
jgi:hypothetical protein